MDTTSLMVFLGGSSLVATLLVGWLKDSLKDLNDRWGAVATQLLLLAVCVVLSALAWVWQFLPMNFVLAVGSIFTGATMLYTVLYKAVWKSAVLGRK